MSSQRRKHICSFCSKSFSRSEHRARHERSHTGMKPFECKVCKHAFVRRDLLQRHIRTVHRELLLRKKEEEDNIKKDGIFIELLVNSMIKVNKEESSRLGGEKADILSHWINEFLPEYKFGAQATNKIFECGLKYVEKRMPSEFGVQVAARIFGLVDSSVHVEQFVRLCTSTPLVLAIMTLGAYSCGESCGANLWHVCWNSCLKISSSERYLSLNLIVFALLAFGIKSNSVDIFTFYQYSCYVVMVNNHDNEKFPEKWTVFHQLVTLMRLAETQTELTPNFYDWFERQELLDGKTLKECLITLDGSKSTMAEAIFFNWVLGYNTASLNTALLLFSNNDYDSRLVISQSHWLLLETAWFEIIKGLERNGFYTSSRIGWFRNCYVRSPPQANLERNRIDDFVMKTILPVLASMDHEIGSPRVALIADVILFLLRFAREMNTDIVTESENERYLIYILEKRASVNQISSLADLQNSIVSYLRGMALVLADLPFVGSDIRVPLMVAIRSSLPPTNESTEPLEWLSSLTSTSNDYSMADRKRTSRIQYHDDHCISIPPLQAKQGTRYAYDNSRLHHITHGPSIVAPFTAHSTTKFTSIRSSTTVIPTSWPTSGFKVKLPPPSELFHVS